jgi:hypothetical protein
MQKRMAGITLVILVLTFLFLMPYWRRVFFEKDGAFAKQLKSLGFTELALPNTLAQPGTIVILAGENANIACVVCTLDNGFGPKATQKLLKSPSVQIDVERKLSGSFDLTAAILQKLKSSDQYQYVKKVKLTLSGIEILELPDDAVFECVRDRNPHCQDAVDQRLAAGQSVTMIKRALRADATYSVEFDDQASADVRSKILSNVGVELLGRSSTVSADHILGTGLIWGIDDDRRLAEVRPGQLPATGSNEQRRLLSLDQPVNLEFERIAYIVDPMRQSSHNSCWATVYSMMLSWKKGENVNVSEAIRMLGPKWENYFQKDQGLPPDQTGDFVRDAGLSAEPPMNFMPDVYVQMMEKYGPIWITTGDDLMFGTAMAKDGPTGVVIMYTAARHR